MTTKYNCDFIHVRHWLTAKGYLAEEKNSRGEIVFPNLDNFGGCTIAYNVHRQADSIIAQYAVAECCDTDRFSKEIGRLLSSVRLERGTISGIIELPANLEDALQESLVQDWLVIKAAAIKESANGEWIDNIVLEDYFQPVNPGYVWDISPGAHDSE